MQNAEQRATTDSDAVKTSEDSLLHSFYTALQSVQLFVQQNRGGGVDGSEIEAPEITRKKE